MTVGVGGVRPIVVAGLAGCCCMVAELAAVRVQAPHFGDSAYVWTNVIGVILAALAGGAALGGFLSTRGEPTRTAAVLLAFAGALCAGAPFLTGPLGAWLVPADLLLDHAMPAIVRGSLFATAVVFAPAMVLLGAVAPLLVTAAAAAGRPAGRAAGAVSAAGTIGSLAGTFATTHWLLPGIGCRLTLLGAGCVLLAAAAWLGRGRTRALGTAGLLLAIGTAPLFAGPLRPAATGRELLAERETPYQLLQVVRERPRGEPERTLLLINEGLDSFHSVAVAGSALTGGAYYDWHALAPLLAGDGRRPDGLCALSIGDAAGSLRAVYAGVHPGARVDGVDIDAECERLGRRFFQPVKADGDHHVLDGRVFAQVTAERWHVVHVDAYAHQLYVPAHLASREFFAAVRERLLPGGVVACNVGALRFDDAVLAAIAATMHAVFGNAVGLLVPGSRNCLLVARRDVPPDPGALSRFAPGGERLSAADAAVWQHIVTVAQDARRWRQLGHDGPILVDDRPLLDELMMQSYVATADPGSELPCDGANAVASAEVQAYEAWRSGDWSGVLAAVGGALQPSRYLRELAGDARWGRRELQAAAAEYRAGLLEPGDDEAAGRLRDKAQRLQDELAPVAAAAAASRRNGWLAALAVAAALASAFVLYRMSRMPAAPSVSVLVAAR